MTRVLGVGIAVALTAVACASSGRSSKASGAGGGSMAAADAGGAAAQGGGTRTVEGRVELVDRANHVTVSGTESAGHAFDRLTVDENTEITVNGEKATFADINPGDEVRASFSGQGEEIRARKIEIHAAEK